MSLLPFAQKQGDFRSLSAGQKSVVEVPIGGKHYRQQILCLASDGTPLTKAQMLADIDEVLVKIGGQTIYDATPDILLFLQERYESANFAAITDGVIPIAYAWEGFSTFLQSAALGIGTRGISQFTVEIKLASSVATLSSASLYSWFTGENEDMGAHRRIIRISQSRATTGKQEISDLPRFGGGVAYLALHVSDGNSGGDINGVNLRYKQTDVFEDVPLPILADLGRVGKRSVIGGFTSIDFSNPAVIGSQLPMEKNLDLRLEIDWGTAPDNYEIYAEIIWGLK